MPSRAACRVVWIPSGLGLLGAVTAFAVTPHPAPVVGELSTFTSNDKTLSVDHPANWMSQSMTMAGTSVEVAYRPTKNVYIRFGTDLAGSLMADISRSTGSGFDTSSLSPELAGRAGLSMPQKKSPLESVHEQSMEMLAKEFDSYQEGKTIHTTLAGLEAIQTDFTCRRKDLFSSREVTGRRYTALSNDRRVTCLYYLPKDLEDKLGPTIQKMIRSLRISPQGG